MGFFDKLNRSSGGYIFISHSHNDIERVRHIRNRLEDDGFEPLCFYLKCLDDESEIEDLIKREIDAREWFIFVDSENSRSSKWVTLEREYINRTNSKKIITVDINDSDSVEYAINKISHNLRIFISCNTRDLELGRRLRKRLEEKDYLVFLDPDSIPAGSMYASAITNAISAASEEGCVIVLLTPNSVGNRSLLTDLDMATSKNGNIIPIAVGDVQISGALRYYLGDLPIYRLSEHPSDEEIDKIIDTIGRVIAV